VTDRETKGGAAWFLEAWGETGRFAGRWLKYFLLLSIVELFFCVALAGAVYVAANEGRVLRGLTGAGFILVASAIVGFVAAVKLAIVLTVSGTVKAKGTGRRILDALFTRLLGITSENPRGDHELTRTLHGMPVEKVKAHLDQAGRAMLKGRVVGIAVPRFALWLANKAQAVLIWATVRVIVAYCTHGKSRSENMDLLALRASLAEDVDELLAQRLREGAVRFALIVAVLSVAAGWIVVEVLRRMPIGRKF